MTSRIKLFPVGDVPDSDTHPYASVAGSEVRRYATTISQAVRLGKVSFGQLAYIAL